MFTRLRSHAETIVVAMVTAAVTAAGPVVAATVIDADTVDGFDAVGADASVTNRAGKLVATKKATGKLPNNIIVKAKNAGKLDGYDSDEFERGDFYTTYADTPTTTTSTSFENLASFAFTAPSGDDFAQVIAWFSAESLCTGGVDGDWCSVRITVDGFEMNPAGDLDFAFDSSHGAAPDLWESHAMTRQGLVLADGEVHIASIEIAVVGGAEFTVDDWQLTVEVVDYGF